MIDLVPGKKILVIRIIPLSLFYRVLVLANNKGGSDTLIQKGKR
jgi:hypothetical protein